MLRAKPFVVALTPLALPLVLFFGETKANAGTVLDFGVGVAATVGGNFLDKPSDLSYASPAGSLSDTIYPGYTGVMGGFGAMLEARLFGVVGLEIDLLRTSDRGKGDITVNGKKFTVELGQPALHVPVLLKGVIPLGMVRPFALFGPEFVFPGTTDASITPAPAPFPVTASNESYTMWTFGFGLEFKLPLPSVDLRIPFSIRGSINPGISQKINDRVVYTLAGNQITGADYRTQWQYQATGNLGVALYF